MGGGLWSLDQLLKMLQSPDPRVRGMAATEIGKVGKGCPEAARTLLKAIAFPSADDALLDPLMRALFGLRAEVKSLVPVLLGELCGPRPEARKEAALFLRFSLFEADAAVTAAAVGPLLESLRDPDQDVRRHSCGALALLPGLPDTAISTLASTLDDPAGRVQAEALFALGKSGPRALHLVGHVARLLGDPKAGVHRGAVEALLEITATHPDALSCDAVREGLRPLLLAKGRTTVLATLMAFERLPYPSDEDRVAVEGIRDHSDAEIRAFARMVAERMKPA